MRGAIVRVSRSRTAPGHRRRRSEVAGDPGNRFSPEVFALGLDSSARCGLEPSEKSTSDKAPHIAEEAVHLSTGARRRRSPWVQLVVPMARSMASTATATPSSLAIDAAKSLVFRPDVVAEDRFDSGRRPGRRCGPARRRPASGPGAHARTGRTTAGAPPWGCPPSPRRRRCRTHPTPPWRSIAAAAQSTGRTRRLRVPRRAPRHSPRFRRARSIEVPELRDQRGCGRSAPPRPSPLKSRAATTTGGSPASM